MSGTVVIVPGIMGSNLSTGPKLGNLFPGLHVWLNYPAIAAGSWRWMGLMPDGVTPQLPAIGALIPGGPVTAYYGPLIAWLQGRGWDVHFPLLDWRQRIELDGQRLADLVMSADLEPPVNIIAHSRGGLVTRSALGILQAGGQLGRVGRVVGAGVPHQGSLDAQGLLAGWSQSFRYLFGLITHAAGLFTFLPIFQSLRDVTVTWPAGYQLLPAPFASWMTGAELQLIYDPASWSSIQRNVSTAWLNAARVSWVSLPLPPAAVPWLDVVGSGFATAGGLATLPIPVDRTGCTWSAVGDGIVPLASATIAENQRVTSYTSHNALVHDYRIMSFMEQFLKGELTGNVDITAGPIE